MIEQISQIQEMTARMADLNAEKDRLAAEMEALQAEARVDALAHIREIVEKLGMTQEDLATLFAVPEQAEAAPAEEAPTKKRPVYRDIKSGQEYKGGKVPNWLVARLDSTGLDLAQYREQHMTRVQ